MRTYILISMMAALPLVAQEAADSAPAAQQTPAAGSRAHGDRAAHRARLVEKFDTNKDGKLDDEEKAAMQKFIEERRNKSAGERGPRGGRHHGAPGQERPGREDFIKKFDKDQDGKLDDEEKAAMQKFIEERRSKSAGERGPRGGRHHGAPGQERPGREDFIKKFDKDQDGKLDDEEKAAMQKFIEERRNKPAGERGPRRGRRHGAPQGQE